MSIIEKNTDFNKESESVDVESLIAESLSLFVEPGQVFEVRILKAYGHTKRTDAGYFDDVTIAAREIVAYDRPNCAGGIYFTPNKINPALLARYANRIEDYAEPLTTDPDVVRRRWLLLDADARRPANISSTEEEHKAALAKVVEVCGFLSSLGWVEPIIADSGNGGHAVYAIDLPNTPEVTQLVKRCVEVVDQTFSDEVVKIDTATYNAARIWKVYGTMAAKGDDTADRPHRRAELISVPTHRQIVTLEQLKALAAMYKDEQSGTGSQEGTKKETQGKGYTGSGKKGFDVEEWLMSHDIGYQEPKPWANGGQLWKLDKCHFCDDHIDGAWVGQLPNGAICAGCHHDRCSGKDWQKLREIYDGEREGRRNGYSSQADSYIDEDEDVRSILLESPVHDHGNALVTSALYPNAFVYCDALGWMKNTGTHYETQNAETSVNRLITETLIRRRVAAVKAQREGVVQGATPSKARKIAVKDMYRDLVVVSHSEFDNDLDVLNCANGVIDLRTGQIVAHGPSNRFTYCVPTPYVPGTQSELWLKFLSECIGNFTEIGNWLQMAVGYSVTGLTREECLFYNQGPTRSGKGTFEHVKLTLLGQPLARGVSFNTFTSRRDGDSQNFDLAPLRAARMISASETGRYSSLNEAVVKNITGNDPITAAFKHRDLFTYMPQFKIWLSSNHPVKGDVDDDAFWGRIRVIQFPNSHLGHEDKTLKWRMASLENLPGIFAWIVEGAVRWYASPQGLVTPRSVQVATQKHRDDQDSVLQWLNECTELDDGSVITNQSLHSSYSRWCEQNGHTPKQDNAFGRSLVAKGFENTHKKVNGKTQRAFRGLKFIDVLEFGGSD